MQLTATQIKQKTAKPLLFLSIGSMVMLFAGLTSAYIVRQAEGNWLQFDLPSSFFVSTGLILLSSYTVAKALQSARQNLFAEVKKYMGFTLILGLGFVIFQFISWGHLVEQGVFFAGTESNAAGSFLYALTGLHLAHLGGGIIAVIVVFSNSLRNKYSSSNLLGIELCSIYWHFLDILWILLFLFLLIIR